MKAFYRAAVIALGLLSVLPIPPAGAQTLIHRYSFNGNVNDSVGKANGTIVGNVAVASSPNVNGNAVFAGGTSGSNPSYVSLPPSAVSGLQNATIEIFTTNFALPPDTTGAGGPFQALFAVASAFPNTANYVVLGPNRSNASIGVAARANGAAETVTASSDPLPVYIQNHVIDLVFSGFKGVGTIGTQSIYLDGVLVAQGQTKFSFAAVAAASAGLTTVGIGGGSPFNDPTFVGSINELRIFNGALTQDQVTSHVDGGPSRIGNSPNNSMFVSQSVPSVMASGQTYNVSVTFKNTGTTTWSSAGQYHLGSQNMQDNLIWGTSRVFLPNSVAPGDTVTIPFSITAPANGKYEFQWQLVQEGVEWFGDFSQDTIVQTGNPAVIGNHAEFVAQSLANTMVAGQPYNVSLTFRNTGSTTWTSGTQYVLGSQNPADNATWGTGRAALSTSVAPGATVTITFGVRAPATVGNYNFQWQMLQEGVEWFGPKTPNVSIPVGAPADGTVGNSATFVSQSVPTPMAAGKSYNVSVTLKNTGTTTWTEGSLYRLGSQSPQDNMTWGLYRVYLPHAVAPGDTITLPFTITAPAKAGSYDFQWRMVQELVEFFGNPTTDVKVTVQ